MSYGSEFEEISSVLNIVYSKYMTVVSYINEVGGDVLNEKYKNKDHILVIWSDDMFKKIDAGIA